MLEIDLSQKKWFNSEKWIQNSGIIFGLFFYNTFQTEKVLLKEIIENYYYEPIDDYYGYMVDKYFSKEDALSFIKRSILGWEMSDVCWLLEFIATTHSKWFQDMYNEIFKKHKFGWIFIDKKLAPITDENEIKSIETSLDLLSSISWARIHIKTAIDHLSDKDNPDYRNSIKESITAVESVMNYINGTDNQSFGKAIKKLLLHKSLEWAFSQLYWYTSDADWIRHFMLQESNLDLADAKYMLVSCSAFINYLLQKKPNE